MFCHFPENAIDGLLPFLFWALDARFGLLQQSCFHKVEVGLRVQIWGRGSGHQIGQPSISRGYSMCVSLLIKNCTGAYKGVKTGSSTPMFAYMCLFIYLSMWIHTGASKHTNLSYVNAHVPCIFLCIYKHIDYICIVCVYAYITILYYRERECTIHFHNRTHTLTPKAARQTRSESW